jgi:hypothetical protein
MNCVCGHSAGHHDDPPMGCWECQCRELVEDPTPPETRGEQSRTSPDGSVTVTVPCDETSGELDEDLTGKDRGA